MTSFRLISVVAAALLFAPLHGAGGQPQPKITSIDCLPRMNEERDAASLVPFKPQTEAAKKLPTDEVKLRALCDAIINDNDPKGKLYQADEDAWTFAFYPAFGDEGVCAEAIDFWKSCKLPFAPTEIPPVYKSDKEMPYNTYQTRSLIALFNPQPNPTIDCAVIECQYIVEEAKKKWDGSKQLQAKGGKSGEKPSEKPSEKSPRELLKECNGDKACVLAQGSGVLKSLVCLTFPPALVKDKAPYTQEQWDKVRAHVSSGKMYSITAATSFILAASALWLSAF